MPTQRQRWPYGAETARRDSVRAVGEIAQRSRTQRAALDTLLGDLAPHIPDRHRSALFALRSAAADNLADAEYAIRRLTQARYGDADDDNEQ